MSGRFAMIPPDNPSLQSINKRPQECKGAQKGLVAATCIQKRQPDRGKLALGAIWRPRFQHAAQRVRCVAAIVPHGIPEYRESRVASDRQRSTLLRFAPSGIVFTQIDESRAPAAGLNIAAAPCEFFILSLLCDIRLREQSFLKSRLSLSWCFVDSFDTVFMMDSGPGFFFDWSFYSKNCDVSIPILSFSYQIEAVIMSDWKQWFVYSWDFWG